MSGARGILRLELEARDLAAQRSFYARTLGLRELAGSDADLRLQVGFSELTFRPAPAGEVPSYHFAFNISPDKAEQARDWLCARGLRLLEDGDVDFFDFDSWNAHAMYFDDADGNIVEFIARHDLPDGSGGAFGLADVLGISEMGIVVSDVLSFADECARAGGLTPYREPPGPRWAALGDEHGLLIVVPEGRPWYPENRRRAGARPATVHARAPRTGELRCEPYLIRFIGEATGAEPAPE